MHDFTTYFTDYLFWSLEVRHFDSPDGIFFRAHSSAFEIDKLAFGWLWCVSSLQQNGDRVGETRLVSVRKTLQRLTN